MLKMDDKKWELWQRQAKAGWAGIRDGICLHKCVVYFVHQHQILVKVGHCASLNGGIFLGSIAVWNLAINPISEWLLQLSVNQEDSQIVEIGKQSLNTVFALTWLLPVYLITFPLSCSWYQEIAQLAHRSDRDPSKPSNSFIASSGDKEGKGKQPDVLLQVAQELYRVVLFGVFYMQTLLAGFVPILGWLLGFVLLSWLNALYSFDYKWSLSQRTLEQRVHFFELHWAYFAGFGSICTIATHLWTSFSSHFQVFWPGFSDAAFLAMIYPLFILIASDTHPEQTYKDLLQGESASTKSQKQTALIHLPIFRSSILITTWIVDKCPDLIQMPYFFWKHRWKLLLSLVGACLLPALVYAF